MSIAGLTLRRTAAGKRHEPRKLPETCGTYPMGCAGDTENCATKSRRCALSRATQRRPIRRAGAHRLLDQRRERQVQMPVGGEHVAARHHALSAGEIADKAAGLAHQQKPGRDIPRRQAEFPKAVVAAGGDIGEVERGRAEPAHPARRLHHAGERRDVGRVLRRGRGTAGRWRSAPRRAGAAPRRAGGGR